MGVVMRLALSLPRDRSSVPLARRVLDATLTVLGISRDCRADIGLAVGEACANVVQHARVGADYELTISIDDDRCVIDVLDDGVGLDPDTPELTAEGFADVDDESGRGLRIIRALADAVELTRRYPHGAALRIVKHLHRVAPAPVT